MSNNTENIPNHSYSIAFTTPQTFDTVLEYLYSGHEHGYSPAMTAVGDAVDAKLVYAIDTYSGKLMDVSRTNGVFLYSVVGDRSIENIKTYHDSTKRIMSTHFEYEHRSVQDTKPSVYLDGDFGDVSNVSVFSATMSVSRYYGFVVKQKDYMINKFTLPSFVEALSATTNQTTNGSVENGSLYFCNNMEGSLHSNVHFSVDNAYISLANTLTELITVNNEYSHVVVAEDDTHGTFGYYVSYNNYASAAGPAHTSIRYTQHEGNVEYYSAPHDISNVDFFYVFGFDVSDPVLLSDANASNGTDTQQISDDPNFDYSQVLSNGDRVYSNTTTDFTGVSRLFDGVLNFSNLDNTYIADADSASFMYRFGGSGSVSVNGVKLRQPSMRLLTGNVDIFYSPDNGASFVPVLNPSHRGFDSQQTRFNEEIHITFDTVNTDRLRLTIHALNGSSQVGLANMSVVKTNTNIRDADLTIEKVRTFFETHLLGNVDTSQSGVHNDDVYFDHTGTPGTFALTRAFDSLVDRTSTEIAPAGHYNTYLVYRKDHEYVYNKVFKSYLSDAVSPPEALEQTVVRNASNHCSLSYDGTYCVLSGVDETVPREVHVLRKVGGVYENVPIDIQYDLQLIQYGYCATISNDASVLVVTGPAHNYGVMYVYKNENGTFTKQYDVFVFRIEKLRHSYGMHNSVSDDGTYMVVTATEYYNGCTIYVYKYMYDNVTEIQCVQADDRFDATVGIRSAMSDTGEYFVVSGVRSSLDGGTVLVYKNDGFDTYNVYADLSNTAAGCAYGKGVAMSASGELVVVSGNTNTIGKCFVYRLNKVNFVYELKQEITKEHPTFGSACAVSSENTIVVSGSNGCVFAYTSSDDFDSIQEHDLSKTDQDPSYGTTCDVSRDGTHVVVGGPSSATNGGSFIIQTI